MAQLAERSLPIAEVRGSNPFIVKILKWTYLLLIVKKTKNKGANGREWPNFKKQVKYVAGFGVLRYGRNWFIIRQSFAYNWCCILQVAGAH